MTNESVINEIEVGTSVLVRDVVTDIEERYPGGISYELEHLGREVYMDRLTSLDGLLTLLRDARGASLIVDVLRFNDQPAPATQANLTARLDAEIERLDRAEGRQ